MKEASLNVTLYRKETLRKKFFHSKNKFLLKTMATKASKTPSPRLLDRHKAA